MADSDSRRPQQSPLLRAAVALARRGWHVFPCVPGGKRPALPADWQALATIDPQQVWRWWRVRDWNIGIACGPSGLVVVDLDIPHHPRAETLVARGPRTGIDEFARLCDAHGAPYPDSTFSVETPSGGRHLYFEASGPDIRNSAGKIAPLVDIRANGGYVVAPGSRTVQGAYRVIRDERPVSLPGWLARLLARPPEISTGDLREPPFAVGPGGTGSPMEALDHAVIRVSTAWEGTRNDTLNRASYYMGELSGGKRLDAGYAARRLLDAALRSGLPEQEARRTIRSGMTAGQTRPRARPHPRYSSW